jgi:hypothetical protein
LKERQLVQLGEAHIEVSADVPELQMIQELAVLLHHALQDFHARGFLLLCWRLRNNLSNCLIWKGDGGHNITRNISSRLDVSCVVDIALKDAGDDRRSQTD